MENIEIARALHQLWSTGDHALINKVYAPDFVAHWPPSSEVPERRGVEGIRFGVDRIRTAFPDWDEEVLDIFGSGDKVTSRYVSSGTHVGEFWGIPATEKKVEIHEISIYRCANGHIVEQWCMFDELARLRQLGVDDMQLRRALKL
jgi:predicted ester cyclase